MYSNQMIKSSEKPCCSTSTAHPRQELLMLLLRQSTLLGAGMHVVEIASGSSDICDVMCDVMSGAVVNHQPLWSWTEQQAKGDMAQQGFHKPAPALGGWPWAVMTVWCLGCELLLVLLALSKVADRQQSLVLLSTAPGTWQLQAALPQ